MFWLWLVIAAFSQDVGKCTLIGVVENFWTYDAGFVKKLISYLGILGALSEEVKLCLSSW